MFLGLNDFPVGALIADCVCCYAFGSRLVSLASSKQGLVNELVEMNCMFEGTHDITGKVYMNDVCHRLPCHVKDCM